MVHKEPIKVWSDIRLNMHLKLLQEIARTH